MNVGGFTKPEKAFYREFANFSPEELKLFNLRGEHIPLEKCAEIMGYENVKNLSTKVNAKILRISNKKKMDLWIEKVYWNTVIENTEDKQ